MKIIKIMLRSSIFTLFILIALVSINLSAGQVPMARMVEKPMFNGQKVSANENLKIMHLVKGNNVYIECIVPGMSFVSDKGTENKEGYIQLYINGKKLMKYQRAAFVIKDLPKGNHDIKLEFIYRHNQSSRVAKEFSVHIK